MSRGTPSGGGVEFSIFRVYNMLMIEAIPSKSTEVLEKMTGQAGHPRM